ncbi:MAG: FliA/WhiG family RNA polymerase sigma factor [Lachnospiraceae bacterium]|jgi:RNA polymerase sigma factor for flagellar operon FliA|nr:FliA/WhiG family RNA polymerase sigma factor [Lachnospiraceae bacterium]
MLEHIDGLEAKTNEELLVLYRETHSITVRQELTMRYLYIVKAIAVQMRNVYEGFLDMEDIINEGVIAIIKGIDRYDPGMDNKFETFISRRIRGMIIDLMRKSDWMPRDYRRQYKAIENARLQLSGELGRQPSYEEIAKMVGMDEKKCRKIEQVSTMANVLSLDMVMDGDEDHQSVQLPNTDVSSQPEHSFLKGEQLQFLTRAVDQLKEKEKMVISLYYVEELNMGQIAQVLNVSEPRISQIHSAAIRKLREYMNGLQ